MIIFPSAKINIGLRIRGKRPDGYHNIDSIFYPVGLSDALEFVLAPDQSQNDQLTVTGRNIGIDGANNLVIKAVRKLREATSFPWLRIHLHKAIPSGAGLGGGSSDAASILKGLTRYFDLPVTDQELIKIALAIGSDCPFFINPVPSHATGRGEILELLSPFLEGFYIILSNPGISISTKEAYLNCKSSNNYVNPEDILKQDPGLWKKLIINDFEDYVFKAYPPVGELKKALYESGALLSSMSGSGSSVFGIYSGKPDIPEKIRRTVIWEGYL